MPIARCTLFALLAACGAGLGLLPACRTTRTLQPAGLGDGVVQRATLMGSWDVHARGQLCGHLQRFETEEEPPRFFFHVQNLEHQDLGLVDAQGRAWRYRPHAREADWVATGTVAAAVAAILGVDGPVELVERAPTQP